MSGRTHALMSAANRYMGDDDEEVAVRIPSARSGIVPSEHDARKAIAEQRREAPGGALAFMDAPRVIDDGTILIGDFQLSKRGLIIPEGTSEAAWGQLGDLILRFTNALAWFWGDWLVYGALHFDWTEDRYQRALERSGYEYATLRDYAYVARNVPLSIRIDDLSFAHHRAVASIAAAADQEAWLRRAADGKWSAATLARQIERAGNPLLISSARRGKNPLLAREYKQAWSALWSAAQHGGAIRKEDVRRIRQWLKSIEDNLPIADDLKA